MTSGDGDGSTPHFQSITSCRLGCGSGLVSLFDLGNMSLTGVFPKSRDEPVLEAPLAVILCSGCGLVQLRDTVAPGDMYVESYGYRSGLNPSMEQHLREKARGLEKNFGLRSGDLVVDIGSNDGTLLHSYLTTGVKRVGVDPIGLNFSEFYEPDLILVPDFFSANLLERLGFSGAKIVTSIAMFYDLDKPREFVDDVARLLAPDGVWHFEQSYLPTMLSNLSYDTICHEHLEYYSFGVVKNLLESAGMEVLDVQLNPVNGGSFSVTAAHNSSGLPVDTNSIDSLLALEQKQGLDTPQPYGEFGDQILQHRDEIVELVKAINSRGESVIGYGASTKGNVLLQLCGFTEEDLKCIAEVNERKFGMYTPGSLIPIVSESEALRSDPDYLLVLPWHFRDFIIEKEQEFLSRGGKLIFPLPRLEIVSL